MLYKSKKIVHVALCSALVGCASISSLHAEEVYDPLEPANRVIFTFNEYADMLVLKPVAQAYDFVIPDQGKRAVGNVLRNLSMPVVFVNSILQGDPENTFESFWSFILNSTLGIGGIFDFAGTNTTLDVNREDFGQTLGSWGVGGGPYIMLPLLGSSNVRDVFGMAGDYGIDPYNRLDSDPAILARIALTTLDARYRNLKLVEDVYETSLDPYVTFRSGYDQRRKAQVANTRSSDLDEE